jgi:hypothetical protein
MASVFEKDMTKTGGSVAGVLLGGQRTRAGKSGGKRRSWARGRPASV